MSGTALRSPTTTPLVLQHGTKGFIVGVNTRISGESSLQLQLLSPTGRFQLARSELTLRSTAISGVAIGLTAGAGAFLVIWWIRSASRRRRRRVGRHARSTRRETTSPAVPEPAS